MPAPATADYVARWGYRTLDARRYERRRYGGRMRRLNLRLLEWALARALSGVAPDGLVLDVPCGTGILARFLAARGFRVIGTDLSPAMLAVAHERPEALGHVRADLEMPPYPPGTFDAVVCTRFLMPLPAGRRPPRSFGRSASSPAGRGAMRTIESVRAREILDSRGQPTVEATVVVAGGAAGWAAVPSGASTGAHEAVELRDGDTRRYAGKGVLRAVGNVNDVLGPGLRGLDVGDQTAIDARLVALDGTPNKARLGANAILAVSLACARAAAAAAGRPLYRALGSDAATLLPVPLMNVINGGRHATNPLDFQEFMIVPHGAPSFPEAIRQGVEVYHALRRPLDARGLTTAVGDEGGFAPALGSHEEALDLLVEAIGAAGLTPGRDVSLALDPAASELVEDGGYAFRKSSGRRCTPDDLIALYESWCQAYPIVPIEDGPGADDWAGWGRLTA